MLQDKTVRGCDSEERPLVVAVVANMKTVRLPFYRLLASELNKRHIDLRVMFSSSSRRERNRNDTTDLEPPIGVKLRALHLFGGRALIQIPSPLTLFTRADLLIVVQANGYLLNYVLQLLNVLHLKRVAFWGHAFNHQGNPNSHRETLKRFLATRVDWWFTYTRKTSAYLANLGFPADRISVIENAIDTRGLAREVARHRETGIDDLRQRVVGSKDAFVALFCGSLYPDKQIPFLMKVADRLVTRHGNFRLVIVGDGPEREYVQQALLTRPWLKYVGPQFGEEKSRFFAAANIFLNPGLVGLAILDSFAAGLPFITSDFPKHSPEFAYLERFKNGLVFPLEVDAFANGVSETIANQSLLATLSAGALATARRLTLENMVSNVADGISACLESRPAAGHR